MPPPAEEVELPLPDVRLLSDPDFAMDRPAPSDPAAASPQAVPEDVRVDTMEWEPIAHALMARAVMVELSPTDVRERLLAAVCQLTLLLPLNGSVFCVMGMQPDRNIS